MTEKLGVYAILATLVAYSLAHWSYVMGTELSIIEGVSYHVGALSVICMAFTIVISVRPKLVESYFGGLDRMYRVHKWLGIAALVLFMVHFLTSVGGGDDSSDLLPEAEDDNDGAIGAIGMFSMVGFILLTILTLNRKFAYHRWIKTHIFTGFFFALAALHAWMAFQSGAAIALNSVPGGMIAVALVVGLLAYVYKQTLYRASQRYRFKLAEVVPMERATEVVLAPEGTRFDFRPGQFAFVKIRSKGFAEYHPFTISSGSKDPQLRFTMKVLGDYTRRVRDKLVPGAEALVEGPYGRFNPLEGPARQVWLAGGIGITPFISTLRSIEPGHGKEIHLFYCVREREEALYIDEMEALAAQVDDVHIHLITSNDGGRLTADRVAERISQTPAEYSYYFCGPRPMLNALRTGLEAKGVPSRAFHFEEFEMR